MCLLWWTAALRYLEHQQRKEFSSSRSNCNLDFQSTHRAGGVITWNTKPWIPAPGPRCFRGPLCVSPRDDWFLNWILPPACRAERHTYLSKPRSSEVRRCSTETLITFPQLPFISRVPTHEPWIISFLRTLLFPLNLSKTLWDSPATDLTDSLHTFSSFPVEKHKTFKIYIWSDNRSTVFELETD